MRIKFLTILLLTSFVGVASTPKADEHQTLRFGLHELNKILVHSSESNTPFEAIQKVKRYFEHLEKKQLKYKNESQFVEYAFYYIHQKLLKKYTEYASINETMENGGYDCVTATAVYSLFFTELEIPFSVIETNYHIYLLVYPDTDKEILLETTDPAEGFITNPLEIANRKHLYAKNNDKVETNQIDLGWNVEKVLKGDELIGVLLFNQSIRQYNLGNRTHAISLAFDALTYYSSARIKTYLSFIKGNQIASN